jgi:hypothetical protein
MKLFSCFIDTPDAVTSTTRQCLFLYQGMYLESLLSTFSLLNFSIILFILILLLVMRVLDWKKSEKLVVDRVEPDALIMVVEHSSIILFILILLLLCWY